MEKKNCGSFSIYYTVMQIIRMKCDVYCLLFPVRALKIMEIWAGVVVLEIGNLGGRRALAVWEIQSEREGGGGGAKILDILWGGFFSGKPILFHLDYANTESCRHVVK